MAQNTVTHNSVKPNGAVAGCDPVLKGKRVAMVMFSTYPSDPRPRRAVEALLGEGASVTLVCLKGDIASPSKLPASLEIVRVPLVHKRGGALTYLYKYSAFIIASATILALRSLLRRYDLVYVHNMPDVLVVAALLPKILGAKVVLDQHDPMPELMMTIFGMDSDSLAVRLLIGFERWSIARADRVVTVNKACKRLFSSRSCSEEKVAVVMNSPDETIFRFRAVPFALQTELSEAQKFVIMYHGSIVERNGLDLAIEALAKVRTTIPGAQLRIYGRATLFLDKALAEAHARGLTDEVVYCGPRRLEDLANEIQGCQVGLIPNHRSAFAEINTPTRIFEYLACGRPVVAPCTPGIQDYFSAESLVFFEPGNSQELAQAIENVALHYHEAIERAKRGQQIYMEHTWSQERRTLVNLVTTLLKPTYSLVGC